MANSPRSRAAVQEAVRRLKDADPAAGVKVAAADSRRLAASLPSAAGSSNEPEVYILSAVEATRPRTRSRVLSVVGALALVAAIVGLVYVVSPTGGSSRDVSAADRACQAPKNTTRSGGAQQTNRSRTERLLVRLAKSVPLPSDSVECAALSGAALNQSDVNAGGEVVTSWFVTRQSVDAVARHVTTMKVTDLKVASEARGSVAGEHFRGITLTGNSTTYATDVAVRVLVARSGGATGIRIEGSATSMQGNYSNRLLASPSSVQVTVTRLSDPTVTRSLGQQDAATLAKVIGTLGEETTAPHECGPDSLIGDTLRFTTSRGVISVAASVDGCATVVVQGSNQQPLSDRSEKVDSTLMTLLHLPSNYGR